jgi:hypothetical protein
MDSTSSLGPFAASAIALKPKGSRIASGPAGDLYLKVCISNYFEWMKEEGCVLCSTAFPLALLTVCEPRFLPGSSPGLSAVPG